MIVALAVGAGLFFSAHRRFGSTRLAITYLSGRRPFLESDLIECGRLPADVDTAVAVTILNPTRSPIEVIGASTSCSGIVPEELPKTIAAGGTLRLTILVRPARTRQVVNEHLDVFCTHPAARVMRVHLRGEVVAGR